VFSSVSGWRRRGVPAPFLISSLRLHATSSAHQPLTEALFKFIFSRLSIRSITNPHCRLMQRKYHPPLQRDKTEGNYMAAAETSRMLRVRSNKKTRVFRSCLDLSAAAKALASRFSSRRSVATFHYLKKKLFELIG